MLNYLKTFLNSLDPGKCQHNINYWFSSLFVRLEVSTTRPLLHDDNEKNSSYLQSILCSSRKNTLKVFGRNTIMLYGLKSFFKNCGLWVNLFFYMYICSQQKIFSPLTRLLFLSTKKLLYC